MVDFETKELLWVYYPERFEELFKKGLISFQHLKDFEEKSNEARIKEIVNQRDEIFAWQEVIKMYLEAANYIKNEAIEEYIKR